jgi:hypothetical protein
MKMRFFVIFSAFIMFLGANAQFAQGADSEFLAKAEKASDLTPKSNEKSFPSPQCPDKASVKYLINYPGGTGSALSDLILENHAQFILGNYLDGLRDFLGLDWGCQLGGDQKVDLTHKTDYQALRPSAGYLSVLFSEFSDQGGANPNLVFTAINFKPEGLLLSLEDLFSDSEKSLPKFWDYLYEKSCASSGKDVLPNFYGDNIACKQAKVPDGTSFIVNVDSVASLGNLVFSNLGATINLNAYQAFDGASGPYKLDIPKEDLIAMGANPAIWGSK